MQPKLLLALASATLALASSATAGLLAMVTDDSQRHADEDRRALLEDQLRQSQKMEALGTMAGGIAHDFNNILTVVIGNLSALCRLRHDDDAMAEYVEPALDAAKRGTELIKSLLSFSREQPLEAQATDVGRKPVTP